jgi:alpha-ketoglutarate-dependent taurine dioxygenase
MVLSRAGASASYQSKVNALGKDATKALQTVEALPALVNGQFDKLVTGYLRDISNMQALRAAVAQSAELRALFTSGTATYESMKAAAKDCYETTRSAQVLKLSKADLKGLKTVAQVEAAVAKAERALKKKVALLGKADGVCTAAATALARLDL